MTLDSLANVETAEQSDGMHSIESINERVSGVLPLEHRGSVSAMAQLGTLSTAAEPAWPSPAHPSFREWRRFARYPNYLAAHIVGGLLENEGVQPSSSPLGHSQG